VRATAILPNTYVVIAIFVIVFTFMVVEALRAARNERRARARGGIEPSDDVYKVMQVAYPAAFLMMIAEDAMTRRLPPATLVAGAALFALAKALKWWAILSLGEHWTFRVIVIPGTKPVVSGPYRFMRHPNYLAVVGELVAVALMTGARFTGPLATILFGLLIVRRIAVENRELDAILRRN
jgi:methyltransferase